MWGHKKKQVLKSAKITLLYILFFYVSGCIFVCVKKTSKSGEPILSNFGVVYRDLKDGLGPVGIKFAIRKFKNKSICKKNRRKFKFYYVQS